MSGLSGFNQPPNKEGDYSHQGMPPKPAMMNTVPRPPMPPFPKTNGAPGPVMNGLDGQRVAQFLPPGQLPRPPMPAFPPSDQGQANRGQPPRPTFAPVPNNTTRPGFPPMPLRPQGPPQGAPATSRTSPAVNGPSSSPQFGLPPPTVNQPPPSMHPHPAPQSTTSSLQGSEPPSARSSRGPSPLPGTQYDAMEGQFTPTQTPQPASRTPPFPGSNTPPQGANTPPKSTTPTSAPSSQAHGQNQSRFPVQNFAARPDMPQSTPIGQYPTPHGQATPTSQPMRPSGPGQLGQTSFRGSQTTPPFGGQQKTPAFGGQQNTPPFSGQQNTSPYGGQQNTPPFSGQQNTSPYSGQNTYGSNQRATPPMQRQATPPMQGQATSPMPAMPPMPGQPPMPAMPPMPGQPPMPGMQPMPSRPPMPGQPPMPNQPPAPGMPPMPGQPPMPGMPPMPGQPPRAPLMFPAVASPPGPPNPPTSTNQGITGRRQYPKMAPGCTPGAAPQYNAPGGTQPQYNAPGGTQPQYNAPGGTQPNQWSPPDQSRNYAPTSPQDGANYGNFAPSPTSPSGPSQPYGGQAAQNRAPSYAGGQVGNNATPSGGMMTQDFGRMSVQNYTLNLLQEKNLIPPTGVESSEPNLSNGYKKVNVSPDVFCSTLNAIPKDQSLLNKARLPLGIIIHPFKDLSHLPVIQSSVIVRCKSCRTYINPFVTFLDKRRWKCNLCLRLNDAPEEFQFDPISKSYGDPLRRPEMKSSTIEFIAPSEYMLRPPQPAVYLFLLDVSANAVETGYLSVFCQTLLAHLDKLPGDARTHIGFISFDSCIHFYNLAEGLSQPQMMLVSDLEDVFLPSPDNLLVNLNENRDMIVDLLGTLPSQFQGTKDTGNALGCALQAAHKLMSSTGGRITVMNTCLPNTGPGALKNREMTKDGKSSALGPATDFYKKMALDCSGQQISVDIFALNAQYSDLATLSCASKFSGGSVQYYPSFHTAHNRGQLDRYENDLRRYITRKIGFEAVMRIRCTRGLSINSFHGNFFVRSTDLLSLPNINPDAGFGMQMSIEDPLHDLSTACFQAALLYTSSKGERRIRVHTLCLPITSQITEVINSANQQAIAVLLAKMAVDRTLNANLRDSREAMINAATDAISAYAGTLPQAHKLGTVPVPSNLRLLPLYVMSLLKSTAFSPSPSTKLDERVHAMDECKTLPLCYLMQKIHPDLYPVHNLDREASITQNDVRIPTPPILQLSSANMDRHGAYLLDTAHRIYIWLGAAVSDKFCQEVFDRPNFHSVPDVQVALPELNNPTSELLRAFINHLMDQRPFYPDLVIYKEDSRGRTDFLRFMVEDRTESAMSYYEFIQHIQKNLKS